MSRLPGPLVDRLLSTPATVIKKLNSLVFNFLRNGKYKFTRRSTYAPYDSGGLKTIYYETLVRALRLSSLKRIVNAECYGFWKHYLNNLLSNKGGLALLKFNYDVKQTNILPTFWAIPVKCFVSHRPPSRECGSVGRASEKKRNKHMKGSECQ